MSTFEPRPSTSEADANGGKFLNRSIVTLFIIAAIGSGIWLHRAAWQNRKLIWQLQAGLIGSGAGFFLGRLSR